MKLLLDEMISAVVAEQLRGRDNDVVAVIERRELRGLNDRDLFEYAQATERSLVTYNRDDFLALDRRYRSENRRHCGIVILNPRRFPQGPVSIRPLVTSLGRLIAAGPPYGSFIHWPAVTSGGVLPGTRAPCRNPRDRRRNLWMMERARFDEPNDLQALLAVLPDVRRLSGRRGPGSNRGAPID